MTATDPDAPGGDLPSEEVFKQEIAEDKRREMHLFYGEIVVAAIVCILLYLRWKYVES